MTSSSSPITAMRPSARVLITLLAALSLVFSQLVGFAASAEEVEDVVDDIDDVEIDVPAPEISLPVQGKPEVLPVGGDDAAEEDVTALDDDIIEDDDLTKDVDLTEDDEPIEANNIVETDERVASTTVSSVSPTGTMRSLDGPGVASRGWCNKDTGRGSCWEG